MTDTITEPDTIERILLQYAADKKLSDIVVTSDGTKLIVGNNERVLSATVRLRAEWEGNSCEYSAGSIYLQIVHPDLLSYRTAYKQYNIIDPVKTIDKKIVLSYFLGSDTTEAQPQDATAAQTTSAATAAIATNADKGDDTIKIHKSIDDKQLKKDELKSDDKRTVDRERGSKDKDHHRRDRDDRQRRETSADRRKRKERDREKHHSKDSQVPPKKPKKDIQLVTNEQLMDSLDVVVDKRKIVIDDVNDERKDEEDEEYIQLKRQQEEIRKALSADGFRLQSGDATSTNKDESSGRSSPRTVITQEHKDRTADILAYEIPVGNSASILRANNPKKDLTRVLDLYMETINPGTNKDTTKGGMGSSNNKGLSSSSNNRSSGGGSSGNAVPRKTYLIGKKPVIVVPKGMTAPITMINAYEFFCNAKFVPRDFVLKQQAGKGGSKSIPGSSFTRNVAAAGVSAAATHGTSSNMLEYEITDNPRKLLGPDPKEWERIVAVIVLGQSWQFKDWHKAYSSPATLFNNVYGFFINMEGNKEPAEVTGWAVTRAYVNRDKRGLDRVTFASFWNRLDEWMRVYKPELLPVSQHD